MREHQRDHRKIYCPAAGSSNEETNAFEPHLSGWCHAQISLVMIEILICLKLETPSNLILIIFIFPTETTILGISIIFRQILVFVWCSQSLNKPCKPSFLLTSCLCVCVWFKISKCLPLSNSMDGWVVNSDQHLLVHFGTSFLLVLNGLFFF